MDENPILACIEKQDWLAPVQETGEKFVKKAFESAGPAGQVIKNTLHGVWMEHPLHAAVTDVPVGSWTAAAVMDVLEATGRKEYRAGTDAAIAVGLVGAAGAALSGLTDWSDTHGKAQRVGAVHGMLNAAATALYVTSFVLRKSGKREAARPFSWLGFGLVIGSAWLGGALSYTQKIGVNHAADPDNDLPQDWTPICAESEVEEGRATKAGDIFLTRSSGRIRALGNVCSHLGGPLNEGKIEDGSVVCPWHGSRFCLKTGKVLDGPATNPAPVLDVSVRDGQVFVRSQSRP